MSNPIHRVSSMFDGASHNTFNKTTFVIQSEQIAAFDKLEKATSPSAFHNFVGRPEPGKCYPNTRVALLEGLEKWASGRELPCHLLEVGLRTDRSLDLMEQLRNMPIIWLKGGAGAGKSAVAQTFAERCEDLGHIVASFFFFSTDPTRNNANHLVATLAYQIARANSNARDDIEGIIHQDPHIFTQDLKRQMISLVVDPVQRSLQTLKAEERRRPCTIIIDGLDECAGGEVQTGIVRAICDALQARDSHLSNTLLRFLICSRPEEPITRVFGSPLLQGMYAPIDLSSDNWARHDIYTFLEGKFTEIKKTHPRADLIPSCWPPRDRLSTLQWNSSGHFIYADTVMKFISSDARPVLALDAVLGLRASPQRVREPFAELDVLYHHILSSALAKSHIDTIRLVFGFFAMEYSPASQFPPDILEEFLDLQDGELDILFGVTASIICKHPWFDTMSGMTFRHKSFNDFLCEESRAGQFHMKGDAICAYVWTRCHYYVTSNAVSLDEEPQKLLIACILHCTKEYDFVSGKKTHSLRGMTQRREVSTFLTKTYHHLAYQSYATWSIKCLKYLSSLLELFCAREGEVLAQQATGDMITIITGLLPQADKRLILAFDPRMTLPICLKSCMTLAWDVLKPVRSENQEILTFLFWTGLERESQTLLALAGKCLEDERMADSCFNGERFAEAVLFWTTRLFKTSFFPIPSKRILRQDRIILNEAVRRRKTPFRWRKTKDATQSCHKTGQLYFLLNRQPVLLDIDEATLSWVKTFGLILSCIPAMLAKASKADSVAELRLKAFPPLANCFPKLTRQVRQAMEEYAIRHGYPAIDGCFRNAPEKPPAEGVHLKDSAHRPSVNPSSQEDASDVVGIAASTKASTLTMKMWTKHLRLRLFAAFGWLDEIYVLSELNKRR